MNYQGKSVIITGAGSGVGRGLAHKLASQGATVYVTALTLAEAETVVAEITAKGGKAVAAKVDVTLTEELSAIIEQVVLEQGRLDLMINNAGITFVGEYSDMDAGMVETITAINFTAVLQGSLLAFNQMKSQGGGQILNIASLAGLLPTPVMTAYAATKHGVVGLSKSLAAEGEAFGLDIKVACLGHVKSSLLENAEDYNAGAVDYGGLLPKTQDTAEAAKTLVKGLSKKGLFVFTPGYAAWLWRFNRFLPSLIAKGTLDVIKKYREQK